MKKTYRHPALRNVRLCDVMQALSDPWRAGIVRDLLHSERRELACHEFPMDVSKATRSHHFQVLRDAGLIRTRVSGTKCMTSLRQAELDKHFPGLLDLVRNSR